MKRILAILVFLAAFSSVGMAQGKVYTKKGRLEGFQNKTVKVVMPESEELSDVLRKSVSSCWSVSPFEFCNEKEYQLLKNYSNFFFLRIKPYEENGVQEKVLALDYSMGGGTNQETKDAAFQVIQIPISSGLDGHLTDREKTFFPSFINIIQAFALDAKTSDRAAYGGLAYYNKEYAYTKNLVVSICEDDLCPGAREQAVSDAYVKHCIIDSAQQDISLFNSMTPSHAVTLVIVPDDPQKGDCSYKMLIGTDNHKIYYFNRFKIKDPDAVGLSLTDIRYLCSGK